MSLRTLSMPRLGETMEEGTVVAWLIEPGTAFRRGQPILEVETDKTVVEYPALGDGVLEETLVSPGDVVAVGKPIATVKAEAWEDDSATYAAEPDPVAETASTVPLGKAAAGGTAGTVPRDSQEPLRATPAARKLALKTGVALETIAGTGRRGRIEAADVQAAGGDETVLLVHGFAGDATAWAALSSALSRGGAKVMTPDLPGHGTDMTQPQGLDDLSRALARTADAAGGRIHLVGHSMAAYLAAVYAEANPSRIASLTLIAPAGLGSEINADFIHGMANATTAGEVAHLLRLLGPKAASLSGPALEAMASQLAAGRLKSIANALAGPSGQRIDILGPLSRLPRRVPVRALVGAQDRIFPPSQLFNLPSRVAVHILPTGHMPQWDAPADVAEIVMGALRHNV